ncbi:MAG: substrate-binding periplasmic protein [Bdellovibrionales bacterium]
MRTKTIRCAYLVWPPLATKDPVTGQLGGVYYDLLERIGKDWNVKIDWVEEVGAGNRFEGFKTGRYDMLCLPTGATPERTAVSDFSLPFYFCPFYMVTKEGDTRFDTNRKKANDPAISMLTIEGYMVKSIIEAEFPKAKIQTLPELSTDSDVLMSVQMGKADATVAESVLLADYMANNPGKLHRVSGPPVRFSGGTIPFPLNEPQLRAKLNTTLQYYLDTGVIEKILMKHNIGPDKVLRVADPYKHLP